MGKESEAERIWSQKKNSLHAESVFNYTLYQIQEGKTGFHEGILTLRNLFLKNPSSNTAAAYARILSLNGQTTFDKETENLLTPEQRIAGDEIFASYEEKQKADLSEPVIVLPAPFEDSSQFHKVQAVYVDPHHRSALVADDWLWSNLTVHRRFFLVGIDESSPVKEVPLKNSGLIRNLQMDAECRYALCCSVYENKAYTEICCLEEEKEVQKLREKQERAADKMTELDALRAKRAAEAAERDARIKEKAEMIKKKKILDELLQSNNRQKIQKRNQLAEQARQEQEEYERIIKNQLEEMEKEKRIEEERKRMRYENTKDLRKMIKLREEKEKLEEKEILEEGRKIRQTYDDWKRRMERIKQEKIQKLKDLNVEPIYIADLERYKIE